MGLKDTALNWGDKVGLLEELYTDKDLKDKWVRRLKGRAIKQVELEQKPQGREDSVTGTQAGEQKVRDGVTGLIVSQIPELLGPL